ncbi:heparan-alpha-glucosaminide N-acetyltransferase domain-containing protein [Polaribacter sp. Hel_I_88]|uniref:heparan-alpha-glucosaminide N-acetyltransferase domain-containing protein n=1 Tax=Polaribacter sp. Hel_I_88 TaxID=1250006 RepID=UPI0009DE312C|nr:heparan-alpha-glucosaminide N-acetyltransferase domain-containing protein [Polaribacter sp. Hel_I_88]
MESKRLYFIDIIRAFAIIMMLQGHFIDTLLAVEYRDLNLVPYAIWSYFRGITAPTFFTISGLIFTYLLLKAKEKGNEKERMRKGIIRGFFLVFVGYLIRSPILQWLSGSFNTYFLVIDVLQCIGLSLILIIILYFLSGKKTMLFSIVSVSIGVLIFLTEPLYRGLSFENLPLFFSNYISKSNGSIFTIIPWFGYVAFGAFLATLFHKNLHKKKFKLKAIVSFFVIGLILIFYSSYILSEISKITNIKLFLDSASYNYLFTRLGNVFIYFAFFYAFEKYLKFPLILKIGQKTLSIYVIHFIIIYGSFTGIGLKLIGKTLSDWQAVFGASLFIMSVCFISFYYVKTNAFLYKYFRNIFDTLKGK